jgi:hypothetical protein
LMLHIDAPRLSATNASLAALYSGIPTAGVI